MSVERSMPSLAWKLSIRCATTASSKAALPSSRSPRAATTSHPDCGGGVSAASSLVGFKGWGVVRVRVG